MVKTWTINSIELMSMTQTHTKYKQEGFFIGNIFKIGSRWESLTNNRFM